MYLRLSKAVSVVLHPFLVPLYMVLLLLLAGTVYSLYPLKVKIYLILSLIHISEPTRH